MNRRILVGLFSLIAVGISSAASPPNEPILIKTNRLIDMSKGSISNDQAILINGVHRTQNVCTRCEKADSAWHPTVADWHESRSFGDSTTITAGADAAT